MEYGITFPRDGIADQPSPLTFFTEFAREVEQMGCAYGVIGDRLESGIDPLVDFAAIAAASGQMRLFQKRWPARSKPGQGWNL